MVDVARVVPILRVFDRVRAHDFYVGYLGCSTDWTHRTDEDGSTYTSEHHGDGSPGAGVWIAATGVHELHAELAAKDYPFLNPGLCSSPGSDDGVSLVLLDPFGNRLVFDERA